MQAYADASTVDAGDPMPGDPMTQQETQISEDTLQALGVALAEKRDEWVAAKVSSGVERRWLEDYDQYMGRDEATKQVASMMDSAEQGYPVSNRGNKPQRSTVFINITRPKTNTAEARVANMLLPTDDRNFGLKPSPRPELVAAAKMYAKQLAQQGMVTDPSTGDPMVQPQAAQAPQQAPAPVAQAVQSNFGQAAQPQGVMGTSSIIGGQQAPQDPKAVLDQAKEAALAMQTEIDDQFQECNWNGETRSMIHDSAVLGTGILKGPIVVNKATKTWSKITAGSKMAYVLEIGTEKSPTSYKVSPWSVYPDPSCGNDVHNGSGMFECYDYTSKQVRELAKQPNFLPAQLAKVLAAGPDKGNTNKNALEQRQGGIKKSNFKVWEYWGEFDPEDLRAAGVDVDDDSVGLVSGCVIFINGIVVKGFLNPLETGDIPYDFYPWEEDEESPWGFGVPYLCRPAQKVLTAAWRQLMDNSGNTVGPQMVIKPRIIQPADGSWVITGNKLWNCMDESANVREAFASIDISNHAVELENIIKLAKQFADEESMVPMLAQGEHDNAPDTVGGMTILANSINVVLGRKAKSFDDRVITRHVGRYVDWNMAYNDKDEIKGDHHVVARGTSALLVRDIQNQTLIQFGQFQSSGIISPMVNWEAWIKAVLKAQHVDPGEILKSDAEISALQNAPPQSTPEQIRAQTQLEIANIRAGAVLKTAGIRQQGEVAYAQTEAQMAHDNNVSDLQKLQLQRDLAILQYAQQHQLTLEQIKADLAKTQMQESTKRQLAGVEATLKTNEGHANRMHELLSQQPAQPVA